MERVEFAEQGVFEKLLPQGLSDPTKHWRIVSADENVVAAFQRTTNEFLLLDARSGQTTRIDLPAELRIDHVLPVEGNGRFLIVAEKKHFLLTVEGTDRTFLREVQTSADVPADLQSVRPLDSKFALASPDQAAFDSPAFLMAVPAFYALKSTNFPRTFEKGSLSGWPRNADERMIQPQPSFYATAENRALVHPAKRSVVFPNGLLYLPVPSPRSQNYYNTWWATIADVRFVLARGADGRSLFTCDNSGGIRRWELDSEVLLEAFGNWRRQVGLDVGNERLEITKGDDDFDLSKLDVPKFGKIDPQNTPHAGGNTWAGGTGGYNTAGLGGVGGPFRLDAGHDVQQISEAAKNQVPEEIKRKARAIAKREYEKRLKEIELSEHDATAYNSLLSKVLSAINLTKRVLEDLQAKEKDRRWAKHQTSGDLDDGKLIEGMTGERNVYRKRVEMAPEPGTPQTKPKHLRLLIDASGSMYRFNGHDKRLQKALETTLLLVLTNANSPPSNEKQRLDVLKKLLAHAQFCLSGDYTMEAIEIASRKLSEETDVDERILIAISDANLDRYGIRPQHIARVLAANENVNCFLILIGSLGKQAEELRRSLPAGKAFIAKSTAELPHIMQEIFASTLMR
ncbi:VWFA domain-containing protein [Aphelenchoides fujianensis]|nr:VWFA domain-containing protein [Aphelenchoides fujianensis]